MVSKILVTFITIFLFSLFFQSPIFADEYYFIEEFNENRSGNTINNDKWNIYPNNQLNFESIKENGSVLQLQQQPDQSIFPWITSKNKVIPEGNDIEIEAKISFSSFNNWNYLNTYGPGIILSENPIRQNDMSGTFMFFGFNRSNIPTHLFESRLIISEDKHQQLSTDPLIIRIKRVDNTYTLYINDKFIATTRGHEYIPINYISIGTNNSTSPLADSPWPTLKVDYIKVKKITTSQYPILFIPGILGSELKANSNLNWSQNNGHNGIYSKTYNKDERIWFNTPQAAIPGNDDYFDVLRMKSNGIDSEENIGLTGSLVPDAYGSTIKFFNNNGYELNRNFFTFAYDWRKDIKTNNTLLASKIDSILSSTGTDQVDIVAHSMGGIVARSYLTAYPMYSNPKIRKYIELGVPHFGSVDALKTLFYGTCITKGWLEELNSQTALCLGLSTSETKDISHNMPSIYQLLPTRQYDQIYPSGDSIVFIDDRDNKRFPPYIIFGAQSLEYLLGPAGYTLMDNPGLKDYRNSYINIVYPQTFVIAGSGNATTGQITEGYKYDIFHRKTPAIYQRMINGDGTVPLFSASMVNTDIGIRVPYINDAKIYYTKQKHKELAKEGAALNLVKNILINEPTLPTGVSTQPFKFKTRVISVHSPVQLDIYDKNGNHTGVLPNGDYEANIPGSDYEQLEEDKFITLPEDSVYTIKFKATDNGSFDFNIDSYAEDKINKQVLYQDISITQNTKGEALYDTSKNISPTLNIDTDGNGTIDKQIEPTAIVGLPDDIVETVPPTTKILLNGKETGAWFNKDVSVTFSATDPSPSSEIEKTEYALDNSNSFTKYTDPIIISKEGPTKIKYRSTDKAGNIEQTKEKIIQIDKVIPEAKIYIDPNNKTFVILGMDNTTTTVKTNILLSTANNCIYIIQDQAGNTLQISALDQEGFGGWRDYSSSSFRIDNLIYNNGSTIRLPQNKYTSVYSNSKPEQTHSVNNINKIRIIYDKKTNKSTIYTNDTGIEKMKEIKNGLILLNLITNKGKLEYIY